MEGMAQVRVPACGIAEAEGAGGHRGGEGTGD